MTESSQSQRVPEAAPCVVMDQRGNYWRVFPKGTLAGADEDMWSMLPIDRYRLAGIVLGAGRARPIGARRSSRLCDDRRGLVVRQSRLRLRAIPMSMRSHVRLRLLEHRR